MRHSGSWRWEQGWPEEDQVRVSFIVSTDACSPVLDQVYPKRKTKTEVLLGTRYGSVQLDREVGDSLA